MIAMPIGGTAVLAERRGIVNVDRAFHDACARVDWHSEDGDRRSRIIGAADRQSLRDYAEGHAPCLAIYAAWQRWANGYGAIPKPTAPVKIELQHVESGQQLTLTSL